MSKKGISKVLEQEVAASFLLGERRFNHSKFFMELNRVGLKFVKDVVAPRDHERFAAAFDKLVGLGCLPATLASTLYCFRKWHVAYNDSFSPLSFPQDKDIREIRDSIQSAFEAIRSVDNCGFMEVLARHATGSGPPEGRAQVLAVLRWYIDSLSLWWVPRIDIVQSSAPIACCLYPKLATGEFRFEQVAELLECLGYGPDPNRQKKPGYRPEGYDSCDESLERNFRNFRNAYPIFCDQLQADLKSDHESEANRPIEEFDYWVVEKEIPLSVFNQPRLNKFDWKIVFPSPEQKQKR